MTHRTTVIGCTSNGPGQFAELDKKAGQPAARAPIGDRGFDFLLELPAPRARPWPWRSTPRWAAGCPACSRRSAASCPGRGRSPLRVHTEGREAATPRSTGCQRAKSLATAQCDIPVGSNTALRLPSERERRTGTRTASEQAAAVRRPPRGGGSTRAV
eukprot:1888221-Prymnesium_polylepis.2